MTAKRARKGTLAVMEPPGGLSDPCFRLNQAAAPCPAPPGKEIELAVR